MKDNWTLKDKFEDIGLYMYRFKETILNFFENIRWFIERGRHGFASCDVWNFDSYLTKIIIGGLRELKKYGQTFPPSITDEKWNGILDQMIAGFTAYRILENNCLNLSDSEKKLLQGKFKTGMELLGQWYSHLWD